VRFLLRFAGFARLPESCASIRPGASSGGARVAGNLARLDAAAADLLPPRDVSAPQAVRPEGCGIMARCEILPLPLRRRLLGVDRDHLRPLLLLSPPRPRHLLALRVVGAGSVVLRRGLRQPLLDGARQGLLGSIPTNVYSPVMSTSLWPAILLASIALPPTSCRHVMLARRKECGPRPGKSQLTSFAASWIALRMPPLRGDLSRTRSHLSWPSGYGQGLLVA